MNRGAVKWADIKGDGLKISGRHRAVASVSRLTWFDSVELRGDVSLI